jgi:hypothetical protein
MNWTRRQLLQAGVSAAAVRAKAADSAIDVGARKQLFIDRRFIHSSRGITVAVNPPRKEGVALEGTAPWEKERIGAYLSVIEDGGVLKMWYMSFAGKGGGRLCYAISSDGVRWERPKLGIVDFAGSRENNIVIASFREGAVMLDPVAPPRQRFKTLASYGGKRPSGLGTNRNGSLMLMTSPDGIHWDQEYPVLPFHPDSMNTLFWDARTQKYAAYLRGWNPLRVVVKVEIPREQILRTWPYTPSSKPRYLWDFLTRNGEEWPPAISSEAPTVLRCDELDPPGCDVYTPNVQPYPWAEDVYLAFPTLFRHIAPPGSERVPMAGVLESQLAVSRDGTHFDRPSRRPYVDRGLPGEADSHNVYLGLGFIRRGHEIYQYYSGGAGDHGASGPARSALMRVTQRLDGFVSADADGQGAELQTPPVVFSGSSLQINIDTGAMGTARVELRRPDGTAIPGYELRDCEAVIANDPAYPVRWRNAPSVAPLAGQPVVLRFELSRARLFAFQFV